MKKNRRDFIKATGLLGAASFLPLNNPLSMLNKADNFGDCVLIPSETAGPFPLDLTDNTYYFRQDVREDRTGTLLKLKLKIIGLQNCLPMQNVRVNIWHCDRAGLYSGYYNPINTGSTPETANMKWLRGYQLTDANGEVEFITIFPGWYQGRTCHIHFQVHVSSSYSAISQITFDVDTKQAIYAANPAEYTKGPDPTTPSKDNIFSDGYQYQVATLTPGDDGGSYNSYMEIAVKGSGTTAGTGHLEKENAKNFTLGQNYPNPYIDETTIPIRLLHPSSLTLDLYDLQGNKVTSIQKNNLLPGELNIPLNMKTLGLPARSYVYQVTIKNNNGTYKDCKMMTLAK